MCRPRLATLEKQEVGLLVLEDGTDIFPLFFLLNTIKIHRHYTQTTHKAVNGKEKAAVKLETSEQGRLHSELPGFCC